MSLNVERKMSMQFESQRSKMLYQRHTRKQTHAHNTHFEHIRVAFGTCIPCGHRITITTRALVSFKPIAHLYTNTSM